MNALLLLIEDDETLGASLDQRFSLEGFRVRWARSAREAEELLARIDPDVIVSDLRLPDGDGETIMRRHFTRVGMVPTIFMTAYGDIDQAVRLVREGAIDYVTKPFDLDRFVETLRSICRRGGSGPGQRLTGSDAMRVVETVLDRVADTDLPVLLLGETGTGKEVAARHLHDSGTRRDKPFVAVNCGALPAEMTDSMLFGHERGAFTGAVGRHRGYVEEAGEGTFFLDEVGDLPLALQVKLLRVIESRTFRRLGSTDDLPFAGRIVCATNRDLEAMVAAGLFREDLWFRINVITCRMPPLRERREEIAGLLEQYVREAAVKFGRPAPAISAATLSVARTYGWPGNIRELINRVDRAVVLASRPSIEADDLFPEHGARADDKVPTVDTLAQAREAAERAHILLTLRRTGGGVQQAAALLGISRTTLWEKMKRYGIDADSAD